MRDKAQLTDHLLRFIAPNIHTHTHKHTCIHTYMYANEYIKQL
jgi:hypothetical protein